MGSAIGKACMLAALAHGIDALAASEADLVAVVAVNGHYDNAVGTSDAASQGTVTAELIRNRPAQRTGELLEFVPGMIVTQHSGDGKANQYFLRGFNLDHGTDFATWVDGMPVNMRTHAHGQGYTDLNFLIPELVQRIDYKKGSYFADEGDFASAGAAHLRLASRLAEGVASVSAGRFGYRRAVLADSVEGAGGTVVVGIELQHNDGPWQIPERARKLNALLRYSQGTDGDGMSITAMAYRNHWQSTDQVPRRAVEAGLADRFGAIDPSDGGQASRYSLSWALKRRSGAAQTEVDAYLIRSALDLSSNFTYFLDNPVDGDQFQQSERRALAGVNASHSWPAEMGGYAVRNRIGLQARFDRLAPVGLYSSAGGVRSGTVREDRVREGSIGVYGESAIALSPRWRVVAGARMDAYRFAVRGSEDADTSKAKDSIVSPKLSLIYAPLANAELFVNYGKGFHSNDARGTTQADAVTPLVPTRGIEVGARSDLVRGLQSSLAVWRLAIDSELVFIGDAGSTEASRASRRHGIEWNNHYIAAPWLLFDLDVALSNARYADRDMAGRFIPGALGKVLSFGMTVSDLGRWFGAFELRYFGPRPLVEDNRVRSAGSALGTLRVGYRVAPRTRLTADVFNLFNRRASDIDYLYRSRLPGEAAEGVNDVHFHPVEPRNLRVTLSHAF